MLKDLNLAEQAATTTDAATPLGSHAKNLYQQMVDAGFGDDDFSGIIEFLANAKDQQA
jgi:3-hydroxyisobutyrate dehydrogenase